MAWDNFIDELKMQVNIVDVVGREVNIKKAGSSYKGLCPFHSEKTPSFTVNEERQMYHCFGCGEKGDVIKFVQSYYKISFAEAVEKLANEYGIPIPERRQSKPKVDYSKYYEINAKAARFFYNSLGSRSNKGLAYLKKRGLSKETITKFGLGYAPASGTALVEYLRSQGVEDADMLKLGLANKGKNGLYDKFRDRVMFPIINTQDKVIGFGGRAIGDVNPKYLNSPESEIFLKKNNLYALNFSKSEISSQDRAIIVEGYMDVISLFQSGIRNVTASLGTALTENQARLLCRYTKNIILSYDSDNAGINAALRGISVINAAGGKARILTVSDGKDPDEFVQKHGKDAFIELADEAVPASDFRLRLARRGFDLTNDRDVLDYIGTIVPILRDMGPVEQDMYIRRLSSEFGISEHAILMAVQTEGKNTVTSSSGRRPFERRTRRSNRNNTNDSISLRIEMSLVILAINNTRYIKRYSEDGITFRTELASEIMSVCDSLQDMNEAGIHRIDIVKISEKLDPDSDNVFMKYLNTIKIGPDDEAFYNEIKSSFIVNDLRSEKAELLNELAIAEKSGRQEEIDSLAVKLIEIDSKINQFGGGQ
ncbi:MAG: DNA primase [Mogibacterium sp.]|nr:DNA primase [Mogibacterium sp.]